MYLLQILIGSLCCLHLLRLARVITLVLVFDTQLETALCTNYVINKQIRVERNRDVVNYSKINYCNLACLCRISKNINRLYICKVFRDCQGIPDITETTNYKL